MIFFNYKIDFKIDNEQKYKDWISRVVLSEEMTIRELSYIFCNDDYLHEINVKYLNHNTLTDVISFDYTDGKYVSGDIFISIERVIDNAKIFNVSFKEELQRVMAHGLLHLCGYKDKIKKDKEKMKAKEDEKIKMFHVEPIVL